MEMVAIAIGLALVALGLGGYASSGFVAKTALIPAYAGVVLAICGFVVRAKPGLRKHVMHVAAAVALLGGLMAGWRLVKGLTDGNPSTLAVVSLSGMAILCLLFVVLAVRSFVAARRNRAATPVA